MREVMRFWSEFLVEETRNIYGIFVGKSVGKSLLRRLRRI
jgi:hypothetical protein